MRFRFYSSLLKPLMPNRSSWKKGLAVSEKKTLWFHVASAGELEILIPIIEAAAKAGRKICVSIFSASAESWLKKLPESVLYKGFSPSEGDWREALQHYGVSEVITSKYEAWPGLWRAASIENVRITVVCAQMRTSLRWAKRLLKMMGVPLPRLRFFVLEETAIPELKKNFPESECLVSADPRWLRVIQRAEKRDDHESLQRWRMKYGHTAKPYWVIGSAWAEDMDFLADEIRKYPGTVWIAPHQLSPSPDRSVFSPYANCILVDEMGLLVELYSIADRAWVGGGWGEGIHSTIEPAVYSIPVACGPKRVEKFFETKELQDAGLLRVCGTPESLQQWMESAPRSLSFSIKSKLESIHKMMEKIIQ